MTGHAGHRRLHATGPGDGGDHAKRQSLVQQDRSLFDMHFDKGQHAARIVRQRRYRCSCRVTAKTREGRGQRDAIGIRTVKPAGIKGSRQRLAADHRKAEAHALLVAESHHLDGERPADAARRKMPHGRDRGQDAQDAVVFAGIDRRCPCASR